MGGKEKKTRMVLLGFNWWLQGVAICLAAFHLFDRRAAHRVFRYSSDGEVPPSVGSASIPLRLASQTAACLMALTLTVPFHDWKLQGFCPVQYRGTHGENSVPRLCL